MKITDLEIFFVKPRWAFLKVSTDEGIVGWGEPVLEGRTRTVWQAIEEFRPVLIGADPLRIEHLWQIMYRTTFYRGGPILMSCISGVEQALWDIKGKYYHMPVYEMLGGKVRDRVRMYAHISASHTQNEIDGLIDCALERKAMGFTAIKTRPNGKKGPVHDVETRAWFKGAVDFQEKLREAVGDEMDIAIDAHGCLTPNVSIQFARAVEDLHPMFLEEPCLPENVDTLARIASMTSVPIATGERLFTKWGFREVLEKQAAVVVQPDICHCGGIFEARKIASMAETYYANIAPHNPLGPISLAACLQVDACTHNFIIQEHPWVPGNLQLGEGYLKTPFKVEEGSIAVPAGEGLCVEPDEEFIKFNSYPGDWDTPRQYFEDGSVAQW